MKAFLSLFACILFLFTFVPQVFAEEAKPSVRFGLIADIQYADCDPSGKRFYRNSLEKLEACVAFLNKQKVDFTLNLGDTVDRKFDDFGPVLERLKALDNAIYHVTGNHDYSGVKDNQLLYKKLSMPAEYYSFEKKGWVFVMLNTNEVASYSNVAGTTMEEELKKMKEDIKAAKATNDVPWNGGISSKQLKWLEKLLADSRKKGHKVLIFSHHPLYSGSKGSPLDRDTALNSPKILELVDKYTCVKALFSGHHHAGGFGIYKDVPSVTSQGMLETEKENSFGIVELYDDKIEIRGEGRLPSRTLKTR